MGHRRGRTRHREGHRASVLNLAFDLGTTLDIIAGVRLGDGKISVHPTKLGVVGHGFGASTAVFAAAGMPVKPKAVVAAFPTVTKPRAEEAASTLRVPGLILTDPGDPMSLRSNAIELARTCGRPRCCGRCRRSRPAV